ncbi:MAG: hypothetical protein DYG98_23115 [Haliscomenobacteraceae bacterium CHB4]|nr:hypothetical protein [Haliscomenobacteraceae bacterium CHB4]
MKAGLLCLFVALFLSASAKNVLFFGWQIICLLSIAFNSRTFAVSLTQITFYPHSFGQILKVCV